MSDYGKGVGNLSNFQKNFGESLSRYWWALVLRGILAVIFGIICILNPPAAAFSLLILFGAWSLVEGALGLAACLGKARAGEAWGWLAVEAVVNLVVGLGVLFLPAISFVALLLVIAVRALISGGILTALAIKLRQSKGFIWLLLAGLVNLGLAALIFISPSLGVQIILWWIGAWAMVLGAVLIAVGLRVKA